jgi:signal transduction histidine kinase
VAVNLFNYLLYLVYGLVFFTMAVSVTAKVTRGSTLEIARSLRLFTLFAFLHAFHEWVELYMVLGWDRLSEESLLQIKTWKILPAFLSFLALLFFGVRTLAIVFPARRRLFYLLPALLLLALAWIIFAQEAHYSIEYLRLIDFRLRNFIGFPGALLAGLGFIYYSRTIRHLSERGARNFTGAGFCLIAYGVLAGLIPSRSAILPDHLQIEMFRGVAAFCIMNFVMNALHVFDIERQRQVEERLERFARSEKLASLGKLAAGIAHEINTPLTNVSIGVEKLKENHPAAADPPTARRFAAIERNIERASKIARELLFFNRNEEPELIPTDLNEVIRDTMVLLGGRRKEFVIRKELAELPLIQAIPWKLEEVFLNLLINAMEASAPGSEICLRSYRQDASVIAEVSDRGAGIAAENLDRIFDPFFTTKEVGKGTGLGLAICFGIMEMHGARIEVESSPGSGTTISLIFSKVSEENG